jgi:hypothetical protein
MDGWNLQKIEVFLLSLTLLVLAFFGARAHAESRLELIENLQSWKKETLIRPDLKPREKDLRLDFIDRLIFQTERKFQEEPVRDFLLRTLEDMAETDDLASNQSYGSNSEFLLNLQESLKTLLEQRESSLAFLKEYTDFSSLSSPKSVDEFSETRSYYDGKNLRAANTMDFDAAAELAERKEIEASKIEPLETPFFDRNLLEEYHPTATGPL